MPTHTITLRGDVQDVGLPELVADIGTTQNRRGFVFNEADGTVKIITSGSHEAVEAFVDDIRRRSVENPGAIESAVVETVEGEAHLPRFVTRQTDYLTLINRQLDQALEHLSNIEANLSGHHANGENLDRLSAGEENFDSHQP